MARTTAEIQATMDAEQAAIPELTTLNSTSQTAIYILWKYIVAKCQNVLEQLWDKKQTELESILARGAVGSIEWFRLKAFEFQYSSTIPQTMILDNYVPRYETIDPNLRIITRAFAYTYFGISKILVAKNEPPEKLSALEQTAFFNYYMNTGDGTTKGVGIGFAGQAISVYSYDPDLLFLEAEITYLGQFTSTIEADCIAAIENFITNVGSFPVLRVNDLVEVLKKVDGFVDIYIENMATRSAATAFASKTFLINSYSQTLSEIDITAGYMIGETTVLNTLADKLTFTVVI